MQSLDQQLKGRPGWGSIWVYVYKLIEKDTYSSFFKPLSSRFNFPTFKLRWQWPVEILWPAGAKGMTIGGPWLHWQWPVQMMMEQHQGGRSGDNSHEPILVDGEGSNWEPVVDQLARMGWLDKGRVAKAINNLPAVDHTEVKVFDLILTKLTRPNESQLFFEPNQLESIRRQGWAYFVEHLNLWEPIGREPQITPNAAVAVFKKKMTLKDVEGYAEVIGNYNQETDEDKYKLSPSLITRLFERARPVQGLEAILSGLKQKGYAQGAYDDILGSQLSNTAIKERLLGKEHLRIVNRNDLRMKLGAIIEKQTFTQDEQLDKRLMNLVGQLEKSDMMSNQEALRLREVLKRELQERLRSLKEILYKEQHQNERFDKSIAKIQGTDSKTRIKQQTVQTVQKNRFEFYKYVTEERETLRRGSDAAFIHIIIQALAPTGADHEKEQWREPGEVEKSFEGTRIHKFLNHRDHLEIIYHYLKEKNLPLERSILEAAVDTTKTAAELRQLVSDTTYKKESPSYNLMRLLIVNPRPLPVLLDLYERLLALDMPPTNIGECVAMQNGSDRRLEAILDLVYQLHIKDQPGLVERIIKRSVGLKEIRQLLVLGENWSVDDFSRLLALGMSQNVKEKLRRFFTRRRGPPSMTLGKPPTAENNLEDYDELLKWFKALTPSSQTLLMTVFSMTREEVQQLTITKSDNESSVSWQGLNLPSDISAMIKTLDDQHWLQSHAFMEELKSIPLVHRNWETLFPLLLEHISQPDHPLFFNQSDIKNMIDPQYRYSYIRRFKENLGLWAFLNKGNHLSLINGRAVASLLRSDRPAAELEDYVAVFNNLKKEDIVIQATAVAETISGRREIEGLKEVVRWVAKHWAGVNERAQILGSSLSNQDLLEMKHRLEAESQQSSVKYAIKIIPEAGQS